MGYIEKREQALKHPEAGNRSMALPENTYCKDCKIFERCKALSDTDEKNEVCQWYPNAFRNKMPEDDWKTVETLKPYIVKGKIDCDNWLSEKKTCKNGYPGICPLVDRCRDSKIPHR